MGTTYIYKGFTIELGRQEYQVYFPDGKTYVACSGGQICDVKKEAEDIVDLHNWLHENEIREAVEAIENERSTVSRLQNQN